MLKSKVVQTVQNPIEGKFELLIGNSVVGSAQVHGTGIDTPICCRYDHEEYVLQHEDGEGRHYMTIYDSKNNGIGTICKIKDKGKLFQTPYYFTQILFEGKEYRGYEVALGKEGVFYPVYHQNGNGAETQIGLMKKEPVVVDLRDVYECFALEEKDMFPIQLYALYIDFWNFRRQGQAAVNSKELEAFFTTNKRLKEKYNPDFLKNM